MVPTAADLRAARRWREAPTAREGWLRFARWLEQLARKRRFDDGDAPYWQDQKHEISTHTLLTSDGARRLVLFEKHHIMNQFMSEQWRRTKKWSVATAAVPWAPFTADVEIISDYSRRLSAPIGFVGDADPHGLHVFGALRSGRLDAPNMYGKRLNIRWLGVDDKWLRAARPTKRSLIGRTIQMKWIEREYWFVVRRFMPRVEEIIGEATVSLLDTGTKAEADAFTDLMPSILIAPRGVRAR